MDTFFQDQGFGIIAAVVIFLLTLILGALLRPFFEAAGHRLLSWLRGLASDFEKRYRAHLLDEYRVMNVRGRKTRSPVSLELEQVYVSLNTRMPDAAAASGERPEGLAIGQAMARSRRLAIIGGPGSGKTTLLVYLLLTYARRLARNRLGLTEDLFPVFVPLRQLKTILNQPQQCGLPDYLAGWYNRLGLAPPPGFFETRLKAGRCLVLLDGLDEVAGQAERVQLAEWVDAQVTVYPNNRFIITSRPAGYDTAALENGFLRLDVQEFSPEDVAQFCRNWCLAVELASQGEDSEATRRRTALAAADLVQAISRNRAVQALAVNPLLLSIIALVHRYRATLPRRRVELYAECVDVLLGKWDEAKSLAGRLTESQKRAVLQPIALFMHRQNTRELDMQTLLAQLQQHLPGVGGRQDEAELFLREVRDRSGLLLEQGLNRYTFSHLTFQEYLVARELADNGPEQLILDRAGEEWWQEVTLLYTGLKDATPVVQALLAAKDKERQAPLLLAGRCLMDAQKVEPGTKAKTLAGLEELFNTGSGQPFLQAGHILAELAGEQAVARFLGVIGGDNEARRNAALWALEQMLAGKNESQRREYWRQLWPAFEQVELAGAVRSVLTEFARSNGELWQTEVIHWLQHRRQDKTWLRQIVVRHQVQVSQFMVELLNEKATWDMAVDCLDGLMAPVPGVSITIARYPVTNAQYRRFVEDGGYQNDRWWSKDGWQWRQGQPLHEWQETDWPDYWQDQKWNRADCPVVGVTWYEAEAYGNWLTERAGRVYRLPAEVEWQRAAQGDDDRQYPWGDGWQAGRCNTREAGVGRTSPVGQFSPAGDSPVGCVDMSGNVWEWCQDWYDEEKTDRVLRGGSWSHAQEDARCAVRFRNGPYFSRGSLGFRLVSPI